VKDRFFNQHRPSITWQDMFPRPKPLIDDAPSAENLARLERCEINNEAPPLSPYRDQQCVLKRGHRGDHEWKDMCSDPACKNLATIGDTCGLHPKSGALPPSFYTKERPKVKQESLTLPDPPIKGDPDKVSSAGGAPPLEPVVQPPPSGRDGLPQSYPHEPTARGIKADLEVEAMEALPQPLTDAREKALSQPFMHRAAEIQDSLKTLADKLEAAKVKHDIRPGLVSQFQELKETADVLLSDLDKSEARADADTFHRWHKRMTTLLANASAAPNAARKAFSDVAFMFQRQEQKKIDDERRRIEDEQRRKQEEDRKKDVEALKADGRVEEAATVEAAPLPPVIAPAPKETAKIPGVSSISASATLKRIVDAEALTGWLAKNPTLLLHLFDIKPGAWKKMLTDHLDRRTSEMSIVIPGIEIEIVGTVRGAKTNTDI
jgi:hypothetical protein